MDDDDLTPMEREFLEAFHGMPADAQAGMRRAMEYMSAHPEEGPFTMEKIAALVEALKRLN